ncbi:MAG: NAD(P)/FAD-dependent oxidoreductase [Gammaproteobacteria bacterium]|nr:NAD(P)/FAD-dependent oxidoreductase [Gammaproteobacteria bacterium]
MNAERLQVDVLVVGLGPAGSSAAAVAASRGLSVLGIDRKAELGIPVQCAEYIPLPIARHAQANGVMKQAVSVMQTYSSSASVQSMVPGLIVDRARFDQALAHRAREAGAELRANTRLQRLLPRSRSARIQQGDTPFEIEYRILIAADGPRSEVARSLGLSSLKVIASYQRQLELRQSNDATQVWLDERFPGGYAWLFPRGKRANLGVAGFTQEAARLKHNLSSLHRQLEQEGCVTGRVLSSTGGPIPVQGIRDTLVEGNILFAGDAAGLCHPITGAGIAMAIDSGECAAEASADHLETGSSLSVYESEMRTRYESSLRHASSRRNRLEQLWHSNEYERPGALRGTWVAFAEYFEERDDC